MNKCIARLKSMSKMAIILSAALMMVSCASTTQIVLLPDPDDGKVGALEVSDEKGKETQQINQAWQSVKTSPLTKALGTPKVLEEKEVKSMFQHALKAQPPQPVTYILNFNSGNHRFAKANSRGFRNY